MSTLIYIAVPFFVISMIVEWAVMRSRRDVLGYESPDTWASLSMGLGNVVIAGATKIAYVFTLVLCNELAIFEIPSEWWIWPLLIVCEDFCYYWFHRLSHEVRFLWAAHENHHSSQHYNLSTALRQSWTTPFTSPIFWLPLAILGFEPAMILTAQAISLIYQFWIHTELIDRLGRFEWIFNTPSHHRVHHGRNPQYLDRNHGGILIVWDRLFGTFEPEREAVEYGLTKNIETFNPVKIAFHEWRDIFRDCASTDSWHERLGYILAPPGWRPNGQGVTSADLRARREATLQP